MQIRIGNFEYTEVWDGVFYKKLSDYPRITDWELRTLVEFTDYEKANGRDCEILCEDEPLREKILAGLADRACGSISGMMRWKNTRTGYLTGFCR